MTQTITGTGEQQDTDDTIGSIAGRAVVMERLRRIADPEERVVAYAAALKEKVINLGIANNVLLFQLLHDNVFSKVSLTEEDAKYVSPPYGAQELLDPITAFLRQTFSDGIDPSCDVYATAGGSGALESLAFALIHSGALAPGDRYCCRHRSGPDSCGASSSAPACDACPRAWTGRISSP